MPFGKVLNLCGFFAIPFNPLRVAALVKSLKKRTNVLLLLA
jgi:hypothetical protein